jgi:glycerophosphoryl diester phosphodiesterase
MSYKKLDYTESGIPVNANYLEHLEQGIIANEAALGKMPTKVSDLENDLELATETSVKNAIALAQLEGANIDISGLVSREEITELITIEDVEQAGYAKKSDIPDTSAFLTSVPENLVTQEELEQKGYLTEVPAEFITETELNARQYLTSVPEQYVTEVKLAEKKYLTQSQGNTLLTNYLTKTEAANTYQPKGNYSTGATLAQGASSLKDGNYNILAINHRGYCTKPGTNKEDGAPENTIPAYILSKQKGFNFVECDVAFTADDVAVLLHDDTIDRTSNGTGTISALNYDDIKDLSFHYNKSKSYTYTHYEGVKIPKLSEFLVYCKCLGLHPYIELKSSGSYTQAQIAKIVAEVQACGMQGKVSYISFNLNFLTWIKDIDKTARLGYLTSNHAISTVIKNTTSLRTGSNEVFLDLDIRALTNSINNNATDNYITACINADLPLEVWTINDANVIKTLHPYVSGVTSDSVHAGKTLENYYNNLDSFVTVPDINVPADPEEDDNTGGGNTGGDNTGGDNTGGGEDTPTNPNPDNPTLTTYIVNTTLLNATLSNTNTTIEQGTTYTTSVIIEDGYVLDSVSITMGDEDITAAVYSNGIITIPNVTNNINIIISASGELTEDGWTVIKTASYDPAFASDIMSQSLKPQQNLSAMYSDYTDTTAKRMSYTDFDIITSPTASYKVKLTSNGIDVSSNHMVGYQWFTQQNLDNVANKTVLGGITDSGWKNTTAAVTAPSGGSGLVGFRLTFKTTPSETTFDKTVPYRLTVYRKNS